MRKINPRSILSMLLCIAVIISLSACGQDNSTGTSSSEMVKSESSAVTTQGTIEKKDPVTLTFSTFNAWWTTGSIQVALKMYEDETGNKIDPQIFPDDQFRNIILTKISSGDVPDLFAIWPNINLFNTDLMEPLDGPWTSKIDMERAKANNYVSSKDGKFYTAPYGSVSMQGIIYNKDVFKAAGIIPPFKTYNDFVSACESIKKLGVTPITLPFKDDWTAQILFYTGSAFIPDNDPQFGANIASNKIKPSQVPELSDMFKKVLVFKDKGYTNNDALSTTVAMAEQALVEGKTAMFFGGDWLYTDFDKNYSDKVNLIGMTACNWGDNADNLSVVSGESGNGLFIPAACKHKDEAEEVVNYVMSDKAMQAMYEVSPGINELGIETKANEWNNEMQGYVTAGIAKTHPMFTAAAQKAFQGTGFDIGDISAACKAIWAGKDSIKGLDDWYQEYAKINKAKKVAGF